MSRPLKLAFETIHYLAMSLWIGGEAAVLILITSGGLPALFMARERALIEFWGFIMVAVQWLTRRRFQRQKSLYLIDSARHLLTFAALFVGEWAKYSGTAGASASTHSVRAAHALQNRLELPVAGAQLGLLAVVCVLSVYLMINAPKESSDSNSWSKSNSWSDSNRSGDAIGAPNAAPDQRRPSPAPNVPLRRAPGTRNTKKR